MKLNIFFRTCAVVENLNKSFLRGIKKRNFGLKKQDIIISCLKSLILSCKQSGAKIKIDIIDDSSGLEFIKEIDFLLKRSKIVYDIHILDFGNNGLSLNYCYNLAQKSKFDLFYFCEDDYLHLPSTIIEVLECYKHKIVGNKEFAVFPVDHNDIYREFYPSHIYLGKNIHWRSINHTTGTLFITRKGFNKYQKRFYDFAEHNKTRWGGEDETLNQIWKEFTCISPLPSLAAHLNGEELPSFVDWEELIWTN